MELLQFPVSKPVVAAYLSSHILSDLRSKAPDRATAMKANYMATLKPRNAMAKLQGMGLIRL